MSELPKYEDVGGLIPPNYTDLSPISNNISDVEVDGMFVGTYLTFLVTFIISNIEIYGVFGFVFAYLLTGTHAGKYGSMAGFGIQMFRMSLFPKSQEKSPGIIQDPLVSVFMGTLGIFLFIFSILSFFRIWMFALRHRESAQIV